MPETDEKIKSDAAKPMVMAYIGNDNPHRGDSHAATGVAKLVAEMLGGKYVYVDRDIHDAHFQETRNIGQMLKHRMWGALPFYGPKFRLRDYFREAGSPDIVIGTHFREIRDELPVPPVVAETSINESYSVTRVSKSHLGAVAHHLTRKLLDDKAKEFNERYPDIKRPLVAVLMGGTGFAFDGKNIANKLAAMARHHPEITFFVCPSRRTDHAASFTRALRKANKADLVSKWKGLQDKDHKVHILSQSRLGLLTGYNPYLGLLGRADHIVFLGESRSIFSEALFTGKTIYTSSFAEGSVEGYTKCLIELQNGPFTTKKLRPLDATRSVAESIVREYRQKQQSGQRGVPGIDYF